MVGWDSGCAGGYNSEKKYKIMKWMECISPLVRSGRIVGVTSYCQRTQAKLPSTLVCRTNMYCIQPDNVAKYCLKNIYTIKFQSVVSGVISVRNYAKGKDKKKEKGKHKVVIDEKVLAEIVPLDDIKSQMQKSVDHLKEEYIQSLSIRSSTGAIENLHVSFEGKEYSIQELGQVVRKDSKTVIINMVAFPQAIPAVLKSLQKSGMNLNPQQDGTTLFIPIPRVTAEHRAQLAKNAKVLFIQCRDAVKTVQIKHEKKLKNSSIAQDAIFSAQQQLVTLADMYIAVADSLLQTKIKELSGKDT